ncbi:M15 family metallopeptidase [Arenimonas caeni]|jgi:D-alanyl-D-alanine carboxypeptidase|uniref:M15 family metallopeptidase n=1 Tax=Arenimonas caeni TaxID=2058085 RepID=UPI002A36C4FB|nr:M15 family metallopeptidase [Arenimonas caeni]MDY0022802.1 D-alanyl-D-alanine carboxypeptidase family protein [Arenimonas caeni]
MHALDWHLVNSPLVEALPARLLRPRARANADARALAQARWCLRRKRDGRFLATFDGWRLHALVAGLDHEPGLGELLAAMDARHERAGVPALLPLDGLRERLAALGLDEAYGERTGLALVAEPARLEFAGFDRYRRPLWLLEPAARAWRRMQSVARADGIALEAISGYRSHDYQLGIFERKLARGLAVDEILAVNAAPGYSEHHGGRAIDIGCPGEPPAEESFESTPAFAWLQAHAGGFGFAMSYPRGNPHGITYEPWHWCWHPASAGAQS